MTATITAPATRTDRDRAAYLLVRNFVLRHAQRYRGGPRHHQGEATQAVRAEPGLTVKPVFTTPSPT
jgi:hypothetical protein